MTIIQKVLSPPTPVSFKLISALLFPILFAVYLLVTSTTHLSDTLWQYDAKRMLQLYLLPALFLWVLLIPGLRVAFTRQVQRIPQWMGAALGLMFVLGVISAWYNSMPGLGFAYSLADVALLFLLVVAALAIAACRDVAGEWFDRIVIVLVAMLGVAVGLQELIGVWAAWSQGLEFNPRIALPHFSWPRFYNQVQSWTLPVVAALPILFPRKPLVWLLCLLSLALHWYVVLATGGRGTAVAVTLAIVFAAALWPLARRQFLATHVTGLLCGALVYGLVVIGHGQFVDEKPVVQAPATSSPTIDDQTVQPAPGKASRLPVDESGSFTSTLVGKRMSTSSGRTAMWRGSLRDTKAHPWLGIGPMNYACKGPVFRAAHPHSFPMQFVSEWGIPAFLLLLISSGFVAWRLVTALRANTGSNFHTSCLHVALATGLVAAAIHACLSGVLIMPASQVAGILVCGWLLGNLPISKPASVSGHFARALLPVGLIGSLLFLWFAQEQIRQHEQSLEQTPTMDRLIPRLWQNGKVCAIYQVTDQ
jgi:hypothetical protein